MAEVFSSINSYANTINDPNFLGMLYESNIRKTQFLSAIAGQNGERTMITKNPKFSTSVQYSLDLPHQPAISENESMGEPNPSFFPLSQRYNVTQIFQLDTGISRMRERSDGLSSISSLSKTDDNVSEIARQIEFQIRNMSRQINYTAINGVYNESGITSADMPLQTRGILEAIETNIIDGINLATPEKIKEIVDYLFKKVYDTGMFSKPMLVVNSTNKIKITNAYNEANVVQVPGNRFVAGINVSSIITNFSNEGVYVIIDNDMPDDVVLLCDIDYVRPVFSKEKNGELILVHPLSKRGGNLYEIYAEFGLDHGPEAYHGKIINFGVTSE